MLSVLTNSFLDNPVPVQLTLNYCSHGCSYCFANVNNPQRKADLKKILSQLKNFKNRNDLVSYYLREKYPVLISNNIDPFSKNNIHLTKQIVELLTSLDIPVQLNTRGGEGWEEVVGMLRGKAVFVVSHPYNDDSMRQIHEKNATSLDERFDMVRKLKEMGHNIIIGINPFGRTFHQGQYREIMDRYLAIGVKHFWVNKLHLTYKQQANLLPTDKAKYDAQTLKDAAAKGFTDEWIEDFWGIRNYAEETGAVICGTPSGHYEPYIDEIWGVYPKLLPTMNDWFRWCEENKQEGDFITFREFYEFFAPKIPDIECNISSYIANKADIGDKSFYLKTHLKNILHVYWDSKAGLKMPQYFPVFSWVKKQFPTKLDWLKDENGDRIMQYHPLNYNAKDFKILNHETETVL